MSEGVVFPAVTQLLVQSVNQKPAMNASSAMLTYT